MNYWSKERIEMKNNLLMGLSFLWQYWNNHELLLLCHFFICDKRINMSENNHVWIFVSISNPHCLPIVIKGKASCLLRDNSQLEYGGQWQSSVSDACIGLVITTVAKSDWDWYSIPARITTFGRMQIHRKDTSTLITQLRVYSVSCWAYKEILT